MPTASQLQAFDWLQWALSALFLLFGGLTYWACHHQFRFHAFISDLTDSTRDARSTETFRVTVNGSETDVSIDDLSDLLYLIDKAGAGRTAAAPEEMPYAVIDYGDGSTLEISKVELVNPSNDWTEGPFFRYTDAKGKSYGLRHGPDSLEKRCPTLWERKEEHRRCPFCAPPARGDRSPKGLLFFVSETTRGRVVQKRLPMRKIKLPSVIVEIQGLATANYKTKGGHSRMNDTNSLAHTKWNCKYHMYLRRSTAQSVLRRKRRRLGKYGGSWCEWKKVNIVEAEVCPDHIHMLLL